MSISKNNTIYSRFGLSSANAPPDNLVKFYCPICGKRAFDLAGDYGALCIGVKCPSCRKIINVNCTSK